MSTEGEEEAYRLDDQPGHLLRRAYQRASANLMARIGDFDLTPMQFAVLARLWEEGRVSQNRLGRLVAMEPANIHGLVRRLARRGLVAAERDPGDRRLVVLRLTEEGRTLVRRLLPLSRESSAATLAPLDAGERAIFLDLLRRLG